MERAGSKEERDDAGAADLPGAAVDLAGSNDERDDEAGAADRPGAAVERAGSNEEPGAGVAHYRQRESPQMRT